MNTEQLGLQQLRDMLVNFEDISDTSYTLGLVITRIAELEGKLAEIAAIPNYVHKGIATDAWDSGYNFAMQRVKATLGRET